MSIRHHAMDNAMIHVVGAYTPGGHDDLAAVLAIAFNHHGLCVGYSVVNGWLLLFWMKPPSDAGFMPFTKALDAEGTHAFVVGWLKANAASDEHSDGDVDEEDNAFEAGTDTWGHGGGNHYAMLAIKPRTRWIGK